MNNGIEDEISKAGKDFYTSLTESSLKNFVDDLAYNNDSSPMNIVMYTGLYGMYSFEFAMGKVGSPNNYRHNGYIKSSKDDNYIYVTLGYKSSNVKCKVRMWREISKIEVYYGTNLLFSSNHFDDVYKELKKRNISIYIWNKYKRIFYNEFDR